MAALVSDAIGDPGRLSKSVRAWGHRRRIQKSSGADRKVTVLIYKERPVGIAEDLLWNRASTTSPAHAGVLRADDSQYA